MQLNYDELRKRKKELITFPGYIPYWITVHLPDMERYCFLKENDLYEEVSQKLLLCRRHNHKERLLEVKKWVTQNPQFKDLLIED